MNDRVVHPLDVFIGFDPAEAIAFAVCANSIIRHASQPVRITPLALNTVSGFYKEEHTDGSTEFAYTRFLVPHLSGYMGVSLFIDGDMVVRDDIAKLFEEADRDTQHSVWCVQHPEYKPKGKAKFRGAKQNAYPKKNWSSVMLFRNNTSYTRQLTPEYVTRATGAHLHQFEWLPEMRVGTLHPTWNWLAGEYEPNEHAKIIHYTRGIPAFAGYEMCDQAQVWWDEYHRLLKVDDGI